MLYPRESPNILHFFELFRKNILSIQFYKIFYLLSTFFYNYFFTRGEGDYRVGCFLHSLEQMRVHKDFYPV